ncbi:MULTISPECIES: hypothetical protein [unclassified Pandoraea]|uniref:hypothetical protein n=1 Tax=unclassified Pandoraea TaxID=2624094 RepID=UPI000B40658F|nr:MULTISPECIES: hypothetical protein [unclassified Pandoraea]
MMKITIRHLTGVVAMTMALAATATTAAHAAPANTSDLPPQIVLALNGPQGNDMPPPGAGPQGPGGPRGPGPMGPRAPGGPAFGAMRTIDEIAHLYRVGGHPENVLPFYRETLTQTRDPLLRHHLREAIAREELKPSDTNAAISTLRAQLSEDLAALPSPDGKRR